MAITGSLRPDLESPGHGIVLLPSPWTALHLHPASSFEREEDGHGLLLTLHLGSSSLLKAKREPALALQPSQEFTSPERHIHAF